MLRLRPRVVLFFAAFVLLDVSLEVFAANGFVADDAVDGIY